MWQDHSSWDQKSLAQIWALAFLLLSRKVSVERSFWNTLSTVISGRGATKWLPAIPICGPLESSQYLRKPVYYTLSLKCISGKTSRQVLSCQLCQEQRGSFYVIEMLSHFEAILLVHSDKRSRVCSYLVGEGQLSSVVMETKVTTKAETRVQSLS